MSDEQVKTEEVQVEEKPKEWEPKIIGFLCNWCTYASEGLNSVKGMI